MKAYLILPVNDTYQVSEFDERFNSEEIQGTHIIHDDVDPDIIAALLQLLTLMIKQEERNVAFGRED